MPSPLPIPINDDNVDMARSFVLTKWSERAAERGLPPPTDLSMSCKFSSMFAAIVFGAEMRGNYEHQFCETRDGEILDLNADAADVRAATAPYVHDSDFWLSREHAESLESCVSRVSSWVADFAALLENGPAP